MACGGLNYMGGYGFKEFGGMERSIGNGCSHGLGIWADIFREFLEHGRGMISSSWHGKVQGGILMVAGTWLGFLDSVHGRNCTFI
jgi:hypothetical protein